jgi:predicted nucleic acid-binding protein
LLGEKDRSIGVISVSELLHDVLRAQARSARTVKHLLSTRSPDFKRSRSPSLSRGIHADLWSGVCGRSREFIGAHDLWIAATAIAQGLVLAIRNNAHFERIPGVHVITT